MSTTAPARWPIRIFIAGYLALQVGLPAAYYLGGEEADERFAWRMFSARRMRTCSVSARAVEPGGERTLDLRRELQAAWIRWLERGDPAVTSAFHRRVCEAGAVALSLDRRCQTRDGDRLPTERIELPCGP